MRCFREPSLHSSFPTLLIASPKQLSGAVNSGRQQLRSRHCCKLRGTATRHSATAVVASASERNFPCFVSAGQFAFLRFFSEQHAPGVTPVYRSQSVKHTDQNRTASPSSSNNIANYSTFPLPPRPRGAARYASLRTKSAESPRKLSSTLGASVSNDNCVYSAANSKSNKGAPLKMILGCRKKSEAAANSVRSNTRSGRQDGSIGCDDHRSQQTERQASRPSQNTQSSNGFLHPRRRTHQQQQQPKMQRPPRGKEQAPRSIVCPYKTDDIDNLPGGSLANAVGISALMADGNAEERVLAMLRSDQRRANPGCILSLPEPILYNVPRTTLKRCVMHLSIPGFPHDMLAIGQSTKAKLSRILCFMHAEQLLDFFASKETEATGRTQIHLLSSLPGTSSLSAPPPLEERKVTDAMAAPKESDFLTWDDYVDASETYVRDTTARARAEALMQQQVPPTGHPVADRAAELLRRHRRRYAHPQALQELNESLRNGTQLIQMAHLASQVFVATLRLDPKTGLTATGVARNSKDARRECAAHALCILQLLQQDAEGRPQGQQSTANASGKKRNVWENCKPEDTKKKDGRMNGSEDDDATRPGASLDVVLQHIQPSHEKLLRFFNLLFGATEMAPTATFTREIAANGSVLYHCKLMMGDITCSGKGVNRFEAERSAMDDGVSEMLLYDERLQAIRSFIDAYPTIAPESIPSAALPHSLVKRLEKQLQPVAQRQQQDQIRTQDAKRAAASVANGEANREERFHSLNREEQALLKLSERAFAADPLYAVHMKAALHTLRQHPTYLTKFHPRRSTLAMTKVRAQLLDAVQNHRVTVVCGTTGCGKTTQVPQYILDNEIEQGRGGSCNILVTQPRRLSSFSVADRIAHERLSTVGNDVGYAVRLDARPGRHITICTTGVLLQIFSTHPDLEHVSHLIIDEVHERDINCDVVLALVKELLTRNPRLRVVLMSATMQSDMFATYFGKDTPVIQVEGAVYPVTVRYLDDIAVEAAEAGFYSPSFDIVPIQPAQKADGGQQHEQQSKQRALISPRALLRRPPKTDYNLIAYLVHRAVQVDLGHQTAGKSILVFLPGWKELVSAKAAIEEYRGPYALTSPGVHFHTILLHSTVDSSKQRECFVPAPPGMVKVVLATNIAESGITIDDAAVVIDTGLIKTTSWAGRPTRSNAPSSSSPTSSLFVPLEQVTGSTNASNGAAMEALTTTPSVTTTTTTTIAKPVFSTQLTLGYASQANGTQRKGRAGRTQGGVCYRLYTKGLWDALPAFPEADIHRVPLTQVLLKLLSLGYAHPRTTLQTFLEPPSPTNVEVSMRLLCDTGAVDEAEQLTPLGEYLAKLPCDPRIGKMIIMGAVLRCLDSVLTVAACADVSPFVTSREQAGPTRKKRYLLSRGSQSDHISYLNAYNAYCANGEKDEFAHFNHLHSANLRIISKYKTQYRDILLHAGLISEDDVHRTTGEFVSETELLNSEAGDELDMLDEEEDSALPLEESEAAREKAAATAAPKAVLVSPITAPVAATEPVLRYTGQLCVDTSPLSRHSFDVALVKACVCAALFPNVAVLRPPPTKGSSLRRRRQAEKVELRTKDFTSIKPSKESACRRVGGPCEHGVPSRTELLDELSKDAGKDASTGDGSGAGGSADDDGTSPPAPLPTVPALFYVFQDVFGVREARQEFLTTVSSVSLWALLLFGVPESRAQFYSALSLCVIDGWIAVHIDNATYRLITALRQALYTCLHGKYHHPQDAQNNAALRTVTEMCQAVLKAPVLSVHAAAEAAEDGGLLSCDTTESAMESAAAAQTSRLVDTGSIIDPLAFARRAEHGTGELEYLSSDAGEGTSRASELADEEDEEDEIVLQAKRAER